MTRSAGSARWIESRSGSARTAGRGFTHSTRRSTCYRHTRILIVDDEEIVRESLTDWLATDGYAVATRKTGRPRSSG